eukprot:g33072.t1
MASDDLLDVDAGGIVELITSYLDSFISSLVQTLPTLPTSIHSKPTDNDSNLEYKSILPDSCEDSIPFSQFLCRCRIDSDEAKLDKVASE